ncbi:MAG: hypothetical protein JXB45_05600 [Candidatus Krumholzibacteriota bacterium]|nr:hypothetical protein [Candidatus Krumholzibacteriota bacterium]
MGRGYIYLLCALFIAAGTGCSSDQEAPFSAIFQEDGAYPPKAGETIRYVDSLRSVSMVSVPVGLGQSTLLKLGGFQGIRFESVLLQFDFDSLQNYQGKTVDSIFVDLPVYSVQHLSEADFRLQVKLNELLEDFDETDTLTVVPSFSSLPIPCPGGEEATEINFEHNLIYIDPAEMQDSLDAGVSPWTYGLVISWAEEPDSLGIIEFRAHDYGSDPTVLKIKFTDDTEATFPAVKDYTISSYQGGGTACVGGVATRVYFEFDLDGVDEEAIVHYSALVLHADQGEGMGSTQGESNLGLSSLFTYYLYTPDASDTLVPGFLEGTGVARESFNPGYAEGGSVRLKIPLRGFTLDVLAGLRKNTGLVLQSDLENVRVQKAAFYDKSAPEELRPYVEIIYSMPASYTGER